MTTETAPFQVGDLVEVNTDREFYADTRKQGWQKARVIDIAPLTVGETVVVRFISSTFRMRLGWTDFDSTSVVTLYNTRLAR